MPSVCWYEDLATFGNPKYCDKKVPYSLSQSEAFSVWCYQPTH